MPASSEPVILTPAERQLRAVLTVLAALFAAAAVSYEIGPMVGPFRDFFRQLPFVSNSVVKVSVLGLACLYAAGDPRRRHGLALIVILAHLVSVAAMGILLALGDVSRLVSLGSSLTPVRNLLWGAMALDGVITLILAAFYLGARRAVKALGPEPVAPERVELTGAERGFQWILYGAAAAFTLAAVAYEAGPFVPSMRELLVELPFVTNSVVKLSALAMLCVYAARDMRRQLPIAGIVITGHVISAVAMILFFVLIPSRTASTVAVGGAQWPIGSILTAAIFLDAGVAVVLLVGYQAAWIRRFGLRFLGPIEFRTLVALSDVVVKGPRETVPPEQVAANVDRYTVGIRAKRRWVYRASLLTVYVHPLLYLKAPFPELDAAARLEHLKRHFRREVALKLIPDWWRRLVQIVIRVGKQLTYVGYYSDPATFSAVGYRRFTDRCRDAGTPVPPRSDTTLEVLTPAETPETLQADVCVIGSGAAGAILAYRLAERGKSVLVVERGRYVPPAAFSEDEVDMIGKLYADGVFQQTEDFRFTILQGSCVGGSTVINNAVAFDPPAPVVSRWNDPATLDAGLDLGLLADSVRAVRELISVQRQTHDHLNPSAARFVDAARRHAGTASEALDVGVVEANIRDCLGCGYCNIGCAYDRKLSMLDRVLPEAQRRFGDRVRIIPECEVTRLRAVSGRPPRVRDARAVLSNGRRVTVEAETFVVAAGAVASPYLLLRSGIGRDLPVGRHMSFNMGAPVTAEFADVMNAYDGLQISHYARPLTERGFVVETWWNPPVAQAVNMPGWFEDHFENMLRYPRLMAVGVLVGTEGNAYVRQALTGGPGVVYTPVAEDLRKLGDGLAQVAELLFEAGALRVMLNTWGYDVLTHPTQLADIYRIASDPSYIALGTGHPQGGNAISRDPLKGVIDDRFRVHGYANLHVCDASVFPTSITVNPQLTVMALAHYAAARIPV